MIHTPIATKTGIVIGGAYVPPRNTRYADPFEVHIPQRRWRRAARWAAMAVLIGLVGAIVFGGK